MSNESPILLRVDPFIWKDTSLNYPEKFIFNLIFGFSIDGKCCELDNHWIATKFGLEEDFVEDVLSLLVMKGMLNVYPARISEEIDENGVAHVIPRRMSVRFPDADCPCEINQ